MASTKWHITSQINPSIPKAMTAVGPMKLAKTINTVHPQDVNSMFPKEIRDRLMEDEALATADDKDQHFGKSSDTDSTSTSPVVFKTKPIADYYPAATLMVTDLVGFTAWSSEREPAQVFTLLETLFNAFDVIAKKRKIFKVETNGDCYIAAA